MSEEEQDTEKHFSLWTISVGRIKAKSQIQSEEGMISIGFGPYTRTADVDAILADIQTGSCLPDGWSIDDDDVDVNISRHRIERELWDQLEESFQWAHTKGEEDSTDGKPKLRYVPPSLGGE